jgi:hypothetical protein
VRPTCCLLPAAGRCRMRMRGLGPPPAGSDARIRLWFAHFSMEGIAASKYGARALGHYALGHRDEVGWAAGRRGGRAAGLQGCRAAGLPGLPGQAGRLSQRCAGLAEWSRRRVRRLQVWHHLQWQGRHAQAPVAVATKTHYFCELKVRGGRGLAAERAALAAGAATLAGC